MFQNAFRSSDGHEIQAQLEGDADRWVRWGASSKEIGICEVRMSPHYYAALTKILMINYVQCGPVPMVGHQDLIYNFGAGFTARVIPDKRIGGAAYFWSFDRENGLERAAARANLTETPES